MMIAEEYLNRSRLFRRLKNGAHGQLFELYTAHLIEVGLADHGIWRCLNVVGDLLAWMASRRTRLTSLDERVVERYLRHRGGKQTIQPGDRAALKRWLLILRAASTIAPAAPWRSFRTARARLPTSVRHLDITGLVSRRHRCREDAPGTFHLSWPYLRAGHLLVPLGVPRVDARGGAAPGPTLGGQIMKPGCNVATLIERYFTERLVRQRNVSANTIASYRDTFRLLFMFAQVRLRKAPSDLTLDELDAPFIGAFLSDLETKRGVGVTTRNLRLTAIRAFFRFVSFEEPAHSALIQRVLAIPSKRHDKREVHFLTHPEIEAILAVPDRTTWLGRRDHTLLLLAVQTGLRLSELISLNREAIHLGAGAHVRCVGKGRKERCTPLTKYAQITLRAWLNELARHGADALFPNLHGGRLSADSVQSLLAKHVRVASKNCPSLASKRVSPHVLRHSAAMEILQAGVDCSVIALWLGHESIETTQIYLHAHLPLKEAALAKLEPYKHCKRLRFRSSDHVLAFLEVL